MTVEPPAADRCIVSGGDKHLEPIGGPAALCELISQSLAEAGAPVDVKVSVRVKSDHALTAAISIGDRQLPDQNMAVSDRSFTKGSLERFAAAIANAVVQAG